MSESRELKWDTAVGLDYKPYLTEWPADSGRIKVTPHDFPPLFKNTKLISEYDLEGHGDGFQIFLNAVRWVESR